MGNNLFELMEKSGLNRNQISKISGISNTFLSKIERIEKGGNQIKIKRKTLINIAVSLNMSIPEMNNLLLNYGHKEISTSDIPYFIAASENQSVTGILPLFSSLALEWFLIGMEKKLSITPKSSLEYVLDQPSHALKSPEHASFVNQLDSKNNKILPVYRDLVESACIHRRKLITEALERGNIITTYVCSKCLERYLCSWERYKGTEIEERYKIYLNQHIETLIRYIEVYPDNYKFKLLKKCPRLRYELLYIPVKDEQGKEENRPYKVFFLGREPECLSDMRINLGSEEFGYGQGFGDLIGFATDLQNILDLFDKQHKGLKDNFVDERFNDSKILVAHLKKLIKTLIFK